MADDSHPSDFQKVIEEIVAFRDERDWAQFHSPRNLAAATAIEAAELQELFLWKSDAEVVEFLSTERGIESARFEAADVLIYTLLFCHALNIDPTEAIGSKLQHNRDKYPTQLARGTALKYDRLQSSQERHDG